MSNSRWRNYCAPIITRVLSETAGQDESAIRRALLDAYPFGERRRHPYKVWRDEIARQRGLKPALGTRPTAEQELEPADPRQMRMFEEMST